MSEDLNQTNKEKCIICEQQKEHGYFLYNSFICRECEKDIVQTETDQPLYKFYVNQMKKIKSTSIYS
ncbi:sigma factor G inhibitor Gin [Caldibacillus lycopersici]|uniref:Sigma factor G inhibitor Gin n=1 Tax=Perspicuibacillus lycopersici TaxID=1325689 RepID=A0AAE3LU53_9BACI|nr:sigma factor G inhibitor Gin [Perspicuibacillus lycopersici]MCU9615313.1 sigma factor G inhibitor Gin [Perspicuibacillus lycopersici]